MKLSVFKNAAIAAAIAVVIGVVVLLIFAAILSRLPDPASLIAPAIYVSAALIGAAGAAIAIKLSGAEGALFSAVTSVLYISALASLLSLITGGAAREGKSQFFLTLAMIGLGGTIVILIKFLRPKKARKSGSRTPRRSLGAKSRR